MDVAESQRRVAPMAQTRGGWAPLTAWSPTMRALNTHGLWLPAVRALRQCRSRFFVVLTPDAASASNRCEVACVASDVSATCA